MAQAKPGDRVRVHYKGELEDGTVFDSSDGRDPLEFTVGGGQIIPGFDRAVVGMEPGESKTEHIACADAYGPHRVEMMVEVQRSMVPDDLELEVGQHLELQANDGTAVPVRVAALNESTVKLDGNHPLAGKDLIFAIELLEIV
jgi:peptidylprolyl isomerase